MELRDFISQALTDIVGGIQDAQAKTPAGVIVPPTSTQIGVVKTGMTQFQNVDFEVTVNADERSGRAAGLSVVSAVFGVGGGIKSETGKSGGHAATLRFSVPVRLPTSAISK